VNNKGSYLFLIHIAYSYRLVVQSQAATIAYYRRLEIAIVIIPSIATAMAGAAVPPLAPAKNIHIAKAIQMIPTMNLSFLIGHSLDGKYEDNG